MKYQKQQVSNVSFDGREFDDFVSVGSNFRDCSFDSCKIENACFGSGVQQSFYNNCTFDSAKLRCPSPGNVRFERCTFREAEILEFFGVTAEFVDCDFFGCTLAKCVFVGNVPDDEKLVPPRTLNEFSGNDFEDAIFVDVGFRRGIDLSKQKLPSAGPFILISSAQDFLKDVRDRYLQERDLILREQAFTVLRILEFEAQGGQEQLFVSVDMFPRSVTRAVTEIFGNDRREEKQ